MESLIIGIAGGSGSGKSTFTNRIKKRFGDDVVVLYHDNFLHITPSPVILVEGILLLADPRVRELLDIKVYVEADADERILRRISRDVEERGRDLNGIIKQYLNTVKPMHYLYVEPTRSKADIVINSGKNDVAFDLFVSKISMELEKRKQG